MIRMVLVGVALVATLTGCGSDTSSEDSEDRDDRHFQECLNAGGSYESEETYDGLHWSCTIKGEKQEGTS